MTFRTLFIGVDGEKVVDAATTRNQIAVVKALACRLLDPEDKTALAWEKFDDPAEPRTLFPSILADREMRVDRQTFKADRPAFAVITACDGAAVRLEYYEGHDALTLVHDVRATELLGKDLPRFLDSDPHAYDPARFLAETFGFPEALTRPLLEEVHRKLEEEEQPPKDRGA